MYMRHPATRIILAMKLKHITLIHLLFFCLALWAPGAEPLPADETDSGSKQVFQALSEMVALEKQIGEAQRRQFEEERRLMDQSRALHGVEMDLSARDGARHEGESFIKDKTARAEERMKERQAEMDSQSQTIKQAKAGLRLAEGMLARDAGSDGGAIREMVTLALLQQMQRDRKAVASQQMLRLAADSVDETEEARAVEKTVRYHSSFTGIGLEELRRRHQALAGEVARIQSQTGQHTHTVQQLAARRDDMKKLINQLAEAEIRKSSLTEERRQAASEAAASPAESKASPHMNPVLPVATETIREKNVVVARAMPRLAPEWKKDTQAKQADQQALMAPEVPFEAGSEPVMSASHSDEPGATAANAQTTATLPTRRVLWRATPVGIHAPVAGKVAFAGSFAGYRHLLIIDHGNGWRSLFGNLTQCELTIGQQVIPWQTLGQYQARQGAHAEPFWFEVRKGKEAMAPENCPDLKQGWEQKLFSNPGVERKTASAAQANTK